MNVRLALVGAALALAGPAAVHAQSIPRLAVSIEQGFGPHTMQSGETYFRQEHSSTGVVTATIRLMRWGRVSPVLRLENETAPRFVHTSDCPQAPNGTCREFFRQPDGWAAGAGVYGSVNRWLSLGVIAGQQRPGGFVQTFADARANLAPIRWFAVTGGIRNVVWDDPTHGRMWQRLYMTGLQVQLP